MAGPTNPVPWGYAPMFHERGRPHRTRIREVGSLPLDPVTVSYFIFRPRRRRAPLMETWLLVPRKITSRKHEPQATALWPVTGEPRRTIELPYFSTSRLRPNIFRRTRTPRSGGFLGCLSFSAGLAAGLCHPCQQGRVLQGHCRNEICSDLCVPITDRCAP